jgi:hypothetical protein
VRHAALFGLGLGLSLVGCIEVGPHAPLMPLLPSSPAKISACRPSTPLASGRLFTDITDQAGLRGITGIRVASADGSRKFSCPSRNLNRRGVRSALKYVVEHTGVRGQVTVSVACGLTSQGRLVAIFGCCGYVGDARSPRGTVATFG